MHLVPRFLISFLLLNSVLLPGQFLSAAKLDSVKVVDQGYLMVHLLDGEVVYSDSTTGPCGMVNICQDSNLDQVVEYGNPVDLNAAGQAANWILKSSDDSQYGGNGRAAAQVFRKSKMNGMAIRAWFDPDGHEGPLPGDYTYEHTMEHTFFLRLPEIMQQGKSYTLEFGPDIESDTATAAFTYDIFNSPSEAIHVNLCGYTRQQGTGSADLYLWMGDGGARNYSTFEGNKVYIKNMISGQVFEAGNVTFWRSEGQDAFWRRLIRGSTWNIDFSGDFSTGQYRLAVEGVGCSEDFFITPTAYSEPFRIAVRGYYFMRIGEPYMGTGPIPRTPLYIPGVSPANTVVYVTDLDPFHPNWNNDWDYPQNFAPYVKSGSPTNPDAFGGHSDALDWDRHLGHISNIWDMLLPYILTDGAIDDDNTGISESGNGIPDIIDEARNEVDFWLNLRYQGGYSHGLSNPTSGNVLYQCDNTTIAAWASAAMLADAFRIAGRTDLMEMYIVEAEEAWNYADLQVDKMMDTRENIGDNNIRGRDLKMMAAAYLFNTTGDTAYEDVVNMESVVSSSTSEIQTNDTFSQLWGTAAYLKTPQTVHYPVLWNNMKNAIIYRAKSKEANLSRSRPSRRATDNDNGYWRTAQNVQRCMIAHAVSTDPDEKEFLLNAMILEADWGLGRNSVNIIYMTTASTSLGNKRSIENCYTSGGNDGRPGVHSGHTPYLNTDDWYSGMIMGRPSWMTDKCYPDFSVWPEGDSYFNTRHVWSHSEFTPRQTMRGKMALYGYLYGLEKIAVNQSGPDKPRITGVSQEWKAPCRWTN